MDYKLCRPLPLLCCLELMGADAQNIYGFDFQMLKKKEQIESRAFLHCWVKVLSTHFPFRRKLSDKTSHCWFCLSHIYPNGYSHLTSLNVVQDKAGQSSFRWYQNIQMFRHQNFNGFLCSLLAIRNKLLIKVTYWAEGWQVHYAIIYFIITNLLVILCLGRVIISAIDFGS